MSPQPLVIIGASGLGREVLWLARSLPNEWVISGILDDSEERQGKEVDAVPILGTISQWTTWKDSWFVIAVGDPRTRKAIHDKMCALGTPRFATLIHPSAQYSSSVRFQEGTIVAANTVLTVDITVGRQCILNLTVTVGHECTIGDFCTIAPHCAISGNVRLGEGVEIGTGARLIQGVKMGNGSMLAAGSVATKDIDFAAFAVGYPARSIKTLTPF
jgi:sugar O-acyltransferase (sialic acid O-acetyltransferase NeuD family)